MKMENEQVLCGTWTTHEHYLFVAIVMHLR